MFYSFVKHWSFLCKCYTTNYELGGLGKGFEVAQRFLIIRNNSNRCWKAVEHLIFMQKCSWKWRLCGSHIARSGNITCGVGWEEVFKKRKMT